MRLTKHITRVTRSVCALLIATMFACSKPPEPPQAPLVTAPTPQPAETPTTTMSGSIDAAGIPSKYEATFAGSQLERIAETRGSGKAQYEFKGARLLHYSGAPLHGNGEVELRMDVNGRVLSASAGGQPMLQEQISEINSRAQLLRSHALAQSATRGHQ